MESNGLDLHQVDGDALYARTGAGAGAGTALEPIRTCSPPGTRRSAGSGRRSRPIAPGSRATSSKPIPPTGCSPATSSAAIRARSRPSSRATAIAARGEPAPRMAQGAGRGGLVGALPRRISQGAGRRRRDHLLLVPGAPRARRCRGDGEATPCSFPGRETGHRLRAGFARRWPPAAVTEAEIWDRVRKLLAAGQHEGGQARQRAPAVRASALIEKTLDRDQTPIRPPSWRARKVQRPRRAPRRSR